MLEERFLHESLAMHGVPAVRVGTRLDIGCAVRGIRRGYCHWDGKHEAP